MKIFNGMIENIKGLSDQLEHPVKSVTLSYDTVQRPGGDQEVTRRVDIEFNRIVAENLLDTIRS